MDRVVADVRRFNRRWTQVLGLLDEGLLATEHPLPEARVLYELAQRPDVERAELRATLAIDDSFLSRLLARLQRKRLITTEASPLDGRRRRIVLTPAGRDAARELDDRSVAQIEALIAPLDALGRDALTGAMAEIERLTGDRTTSPVGHAARRHPPRRPRLGGATQRRGVRGRVRVGPTYEALVAQIVADFARDLVADRERVWIAEVDGHRAGCVFCKQRDADTAQLRLLLVDPGPAASGSAGASSTPASTSPAPPATAGSCCGPTTCSSPPAASTSPPASSSSRRSRTTASATTSSGRSGHATSSVRAVFLYGVVNASPDSKQRDSIVATPEEAVARARMLLERGADGIDVGGQGSTDEATVVDWTVEWARLEPIIPALATLGVPLSVDSWRPEVVRRALEAGATVINAADGMQADAMWRVAAEFDVPIVVPFLSGPNPRRWRYVRADPIEALVEFFTDRLRRRRPLRPAPPLHPRSRHRVRPRRRRVERALPLPEARVLEPRRAAPVRPAAVHRAAVEGVTAARGAAGDRRRQGLEYGRSPPTVAGRATSRPDAGGRSVEQRATRVDAGRRQALVPAGGQRSGATSASGVSTKRRSSNSGCGIVSSGDDIVTSS